VLSTKDITTRLDRLIEIGESMNNSKMDSLEKEMRSIHDWRIKRESSVQSTSDTMTWFWRFAPWIVGMIFMAAEFKYLKG